MVVSHYRLAIAHLMLVPDTSCVCDLELWELEGGMFSRRRKRRMGARRGVGVVVVGCMGLMFRTGTSMQLY